MTVGVRAGPLDVFSWDVWPSEQPVGPAGGAEARTGSDLLPARFYVAEPLWPPSSYRSAVRLLQPAAAVMAAGTVRCQFFEPSLAFKKIHC